MKKLKNNLENNKKAVSLKIIPKEKKPLTKNQQLFNKLTQRIENLEKEIIEENEKCIRILEFFAKDLKPLLGENAKTRFQLAMVLGKTTEKIKYGKKQLKDVTDIILALCTEAFTQIEPDTEQETFYDQWSKTTYKEELKTQEEDAKEMLSNFMNQAFGMEINMDEFEISPEGAARFQQKLKTEFEKAQENKSNQKIKKTKKQIQQEEQMKAEEEIKNKSIRSIYIALAKLLHPDAETDETLKVEKEEIMKKVTFAYENKDLPTLLKLEMEWVHKETEHLEKLTEDKLKIFISALKQQVSELEQEKMAFQMNPRFADISEYTGLSEKIAFKQILSDIKDQKNIAGEFKKLISNFEAATDKKEIMEFVNEYLDVLSENQTMDMLSEMFGVSGF